MTTEGLDLYLHRNQCLSKTLIRHITRLLPTANPSCQLMPNRLRSPYPHPRLIIIPRMVVSSLSINNLLPTTQQVWTPRNLGFQFPLNPSLFRRLPIRHPRLLPNRIPYLRTSLLKIQCSSALMFLGNSLRKIGLTCIIPLLQVCRGDQMGTSGMKEHMKCKPYTLLKAMVKKDRQ